MRRLTLGMSVIVVALLVVSCTTGKGSFSLINKATEPIVRALVVISEQTIELRDIPPGKTAEGHYDVKSDSQFIIEIQFQSGKKLRKEVGYITNGMDFQHEFTVTDSDIEITASKAM